MSESHQRQMQLFSENSGKYVSTYSAQFKSDFLKVLKHRFQENRVFANVVYNEYIKDRHHVHMNSTMWSSLTDLCKYLGREGLCKVDETEKGWYISYIDRNPEKLAREEADKRRTKMDMDDADRAAKALQEQIRRGQEQYQVDTSVSEATDEEARAMFLKQHGEGAAVKVELKPIAKKTQIRKFKGIVADPDMMDNENDDYGDDGRPVKKSSNDDGDGNHGDDDDEKDKGYSREDGNDEGHKSRRGSDKPKPSSSSTAPSTSKPSLSSALDPAAAPRADGEMTDEEVAKLFDIQPSTTSQKDSKKRKATDVLESLMEEKEIEKRNTLHSRYSTTHQSEGKAWIMPGIIVKITNRVVAGGSLYKQKGVVEKVAGYLAHVQVVDSTTKIKIDQEDLETVIPAIGGAVVFVQGPYRGLKAELQSVDIEKFNCTVVMTTRQNKGERVRGVAYEDISKLAE
eukprot:c11158_g1_i1.p1 GENE.c11158_g1_i1~~c11158_g1_i1.p1  ORF type:complete len:509 (-),score=143.86 c11158_g1_i1:92-1459(-)